MANKLKVGVTSVAFSKDAELRSMLSNYGFDCRFNNTGRFSRAELFDYLSDLDGAIVGLDRIDAEVLQHCPNLKVVSKYGVGLDNIDFDACSDSAIRVVHCPGVNKRSVAEQALAFMLSLCRNISITSQRMKSGEWFKNGGVQLSGKTVGIIGLGNIGKEVATLLQPFGCKILVNDIIDVADYSQEHGLTISDKEQIFQESDIVTIHTPLTEQTRDMIDLKTLQSMKPGAFLVNTARGGIVNEDALKQALLAKTIAGAALDVYSEEPPSDIEFLNLENLICTPHVAGNAQEAVRAMGIAAIEQLVATLTEIK